MALRPGDDGICGDGYLIEMVNQGVLLGVVDGVGSREQATATKWRAIESVRECRLMRPGEVLRMCHQALRGTSGVAMGLALVDTDSDTLTYVAVGTTALRFVGFQGAPLLPSAGLVGVNLGSPREETLPYQPGQLIVMHTAGIRDGFDIDHYPAPIRDDLGSLAQAIAQEWSSEQDDGVVLLAQ
ncbi:MAG: SpoIIE family protein phosphatase [Dehalococcoidia bacterium]